MAHVADWTFAADGNGAAQVLTARNAFALYAWGTWGSGTLTFEYSPNGGTTWIALSGVSLTANGNSSALRLPPGFQIRAVLAGSTNPALNVTVDELCAA